MAKYTINYSCGHGSIEKNLTGKHTDRERRVNWMESNMVCPECYRNIKIKEDADAEKIATVCLVPSSQPIISIEVKGQTLSNKDELYKMGYRWSESTSKGLMGYAAVSNPERVLSLQYEIDSVDKAVYWMNEQKAVLISIGYKVALEMSDIDQAYLGYLLDKKIKDEKEKKQAIKLLTEIKKRDPRPKMSNLVYRIRQIEKEVGGQKWNRTIYGRKGNYNFYVNNEKYTATDNEVAEREKILKAVSNWDEKYKTEIENATK